MITELNSLKKYLKKSLIPTFTGITRRVINFSLCDILLNREENMNQLNNTNLNKTINVLFIITNAGGGHISAARSIISALNELYPNRINYTIKSIIDIIGPLGKMVGKVCEDAYNYSIQKGFYRFEPLIYALLKDVGNNKLLVSTRVNCVKNYIEKINPDVIVSIMHGTGEVVSSAINKLNKKVPNVIVVTDPINVRKTWVSNKADLIIVATEEAKRYCLLHGIKEEKIKVVGFPVDTKFYKPTSSEEKLEICKKYNINPNLFTVMIMMGGPGGKNIYKFSKKLNDANLPIQIIACCGRDKKVLKKLQKLSKISSIPIIPLGFTWDIPDLMSISSLIITKPGPGTIMEAILKELPIIIDSTASYIMWQEKGNLEYVKNNNLGKVIYNISELIPTINEFIHNKELYNTVINNLKAHKNLVNTYGIAEDIINLCEFNKKM